MQYETTQHNIQKNTTQHNITHYNTMKTPQLTKLNNTTAYQATLPTCLAWSVSALWGTEGPHKVLTAHCQDPYPDPEPGHLGPPGSWTAACTAPPGSWLHLTSH